jgi:hypothetical protein
MKTLILGTMALTMLAGCGGEGPPVGGPDRLPASVTATGGGVLVIHPSINPVYLVAMEAPIRVTESGGGTASWDFARMSIFLEGREIERSEMSAGALQAAGFARIAANTNQVYRTIFRFNAEDFDRIDITLGFTDASDGRSFTIDVPLGSFDDVDLSFTPLSLSRSPLPL